MINKFINELIVYGLNKSLVLEDDKIYVTNRLLELFELSDFKEEDVQERPINEILDDMVAYALSKGLIAEDTITMRDLFDTKIMGLLTPAPSVVRYNFHTIRKINSKIATDYFYSFSQRTNYIRMDRIEKNKKWKVETPYGLMDITINLSKPEKDPKDIAKAGQMKKSGYPSCLLCLENEGFSGNVIQPARQNHRVIPLRLAGDDYYLQYSPYVYYNEHCIVFNKKHVPMVIDRNTFCKLLEFVKQFKHYTIGSNADLPIVGGSILSHDHFQGGGYTFAMERAAYDRTFQVSGYEDITFGVVKWPMSVIRLQGNSIERVVEASDYILSKWRNYTDEDAFIYAQTEGTPHNTITPIARMRGDMYEMDLVLRNNITTEENPWGVYHPSVDLHHIKKENIGLIEVMGLAVLPARLDSEMTQVEDCILNRKSIRDNAEIEKHADWVEQWIHNYDITASNIHGIIQNEIGKVFVKVLECAGVYKRNADGQKAFDRFLNTL